MHRNGLEVKGDVHKAMEEQEVQGQTAVLCVINGGSASDSNAKQVMVLGQCTEKS